MKYIKTYKELMINESSSDDILNFIDKLNFINDNYIIDYFCDGSAIIITYHLPNRPLVSDYNDDLDKLYNDIKEEVGIYDFEYHLIVNDEYKELRLVIIDKNFTKNNDFDTFRFEDMVHDERIKIWRFRKELNGKFFSCIYGQYIRDYEIMTSDDPDPYNVENIEIANVHLLDWQYKIKNGLS